ncbi:hypothetical protein [Methanoregula sp.]
MSFSPGPLRNNASVTAFALAGIRYFETTASAATSAVTRTGYRMANT